MRAHSAVSLPLPKIDALPLGAHRVSEQAESQASLTVLTDAALFEAIGVRIAFTQRGQYEGEGVSTGPFARLNLALHVPDDREAVMQNRSLLIRQLAGSDVPFVIPNQVHGTHVVFVKDASGASAAQKEADLGADAVLVRASRVGALLCFADCLPLILVAPDGSFAVVHAGWRGAVAHIAGKACRALAEKCEMSPATFNAYIGPHIRSECFEVGKEVVGQFANEFGDEVVADDRHVSLACAVSIDLERVGMNYARIADACVCTKCHPDKYFSYRASDGACGRHGAVAISLGLSGLDSKR